MLDSLPFDLVFMDCEMPEMDGYEATAEIRRRTDAKRNLPIIAVTAKATQGDRDYCLQAGMDDYMSKPVKTEGFRAALERWRPGGKDEDASQEVNGAEVNGKSVNGAVHNATTVASVETQSVPAIDPALDAEVVERLRDLAAATDESLLGQIFDAFLSDGEARLIALRHALQDSDSAGLRKAAHALKGASANIGARRMAEITEQLQALGEAGSVEGAAPLIDTLQVEFVGVRAEIAAELEKP
jgi:CheY-like chemotaxis protein